MEEGGGGGKVNFSANLFLFCNISVSIFIERLGLHYPIKFGLYLHSNSG